MTDDPIAFCFVMMFTGVSAACFGYAVMQTMFMPLGAPAWTY